MFMRSRTIRFTLIATLALMALASIGAISRLPDAAATQPSARDAADGIVAAAGVIRPTRMTSIPYGIDTAVLDGDVIRVTGHDGTIGENAVNPGDVCPEGDCTQHIKVFVRDRNKPGTFAKGAWKGVWPIDGGMWTAEALIKSNNSPSNFKIGDEVWVCATAQVRTDGPGKKGRAVGFRHWCKTVPLGPLPSSAD